jgi:hypothetical protein
MVFEMEKEEVNQIYVQNEHSWNNNLEPNKLIQKREQRRKEKRQNKFDRKNIRQRIESVKKLRSQSKAMTGDLEGLKIAMGKSQLTQSKVEISKSILSKVRSGVTSRNAIQKKGPK